VPKLEIIRLKALFTALCAGTSLARLRQDELKQTFTTDPSIAGAILRLEEDWNKQ
jgi:hypothetical protein